MTSAPLADRRILILEDDYYQAQDCRQLLEAAGAKVVAMTAAAPDRAALLMLGRVDAALIDINLGEGCSLGFARVLNEEAIPFVFLTGYDAAMLPGDLAGSPCISKPADGARILAELRAAMGADA